MFDIECKKCGGSVLMNEMLTRDEYMKDIRCLVDENGDLLESSIQQYLIYSCVSCRAVYKLSYKEWEKMFRSKLTKEVMEIRKQKAFKELNPHIIDPDNGMDFCGQCDGIEDGNCYVDIIKQCSIRKK